MNKIEEIDKALTEAHLKFDQVNSGPAEDKSGGYAFIIGTLFGTLKGIKSDLEVERGIKK